MSAPLEIATTLAHALDHRDYDRAATILHRDCTYDISGERITGRDAIIASYRASDDWGCANVDAVDFESTTSPMGDGRFAVDYLDRLSHLGQQHEHRCRQMLTVEHGKVIHVEHVDLPGEPEALKAYFERVGVTR